ncbi:GmrSD restriction endonuclease domain-containing protein [Streptomyces sp. MAR4 CNX-425]|uniref:GmrSD restriction endonuclease domain-containing protein n=1 Tax=Streptomyces sp. MAR4 CNX-425 TaxID=3406343 RepID=UPI003B50FD62
MAATLYRDTGYVLSHLIEEIKHGRIGLPDIQRPFVWSAAKVRDLFDSLYRGYPVGTLMFWETGAEVGTRRIGGRDGDDDEADRAPRLLVVDGQQRLTSLYAVLTGRPVLTKEFDRRSIRLAFRPEDETFEVTDAAIERDPEFIPDITTLWGGGYKSTVRDFLNRLADYRGGGLSDEEQDRLEERVDGVRDLKEFRFQVIELGASADEEQVADIFVRINSEGVKLSQADFVLTLMSVHWEKGRRELEAFCRAAVDATRTGPSPKNPFLEPSPDQLLRVGVGIAFNRGRLQHVYSLLRGKDMDTGEVSAGRREEQFARMRRAQDEVLDLTNWHEYLKCLTAAGFRSRRMITSENAVIFTYILWLIGRGRFGLDFATLRGVISRWFFMAHTTGRYTSSPESQVEADLARVAALDHREPDVFRTELDRIVRSNFTGDYWDISLPNRLDTSASRSPALYAYYAALNLLDAELLFSRLKIRDVTGSDEAPRSVERHHLFPKAFLRAQGVTHSRQVNAIANMAFMDWPENTRGAADGPLDQWAAMAHELGPERLRQQAFWHALPVGWEQLDYPTFLERRRVLMARVIRDGFDSLWDDTAPAPSATVPDLLRAGESQTVEFKSTARWSVRAGQLDRKLEHVVVKTVCALLNAEGGALLIGVDDDANVLGLDADWRTLGPRGNRDGYELWLRQLLDTNLSQQTAGVVRIRYETVDGKDVCVVSVAASGRPTFAKPQGGQRATEFWVRIGNASKQLHGEDMATYRSRHWG